MPTNNRPRFRVHTLGLNDIEFYVPLKMAHACSHQGACDDDCSHYAKMFTRALSQVPDDLYRRCLKTYGINGVDEMTTETLHLYAIWLTAGNVQEDFAQPSSGHKPSCWTSLSTY